MMQSSRSCGGSRGAALQAIEPFFSAPGAVGLCASCTGIPALMIGSVGSAKN
ncbi:MAG TPA: hypothetical protein V6C65_40415 [Allocoleopsis sp.]